MDGRPLPDGPMITLEVDTGRVGGFAGCNAYGGEASRGPGGALEVSDIASTAMACADPAPMERETAYLGHLADATALRREGERLVLDTSGGRGTLVFEPLPASAGDPASLVGSSWRLESLDGRAPEGTYTMSFPARGVAEGRAGCRRYRALYAVAEGRISFPQQSMEGEPCDALAVEEGSFTDALTWAAWYRIATDRWELRTLRGETLVFVREGEGAGG
jgi:heat shock protein HslJ